METAQKIARLEAEKQQLVQQAIITENALQGTRQQVSFIDGQLTELRLILPDNPTEQEETEETSEDKPKKRKYKKRQVKEKQKYKSYQPERTSSGRIKPKKKKLFSEEVDAFIEKKWENHSDKELRELIGNKLKVWFSIDQLKGHRALRGWVADRPGHKTKKVDDDDDFDDVADVLDEN